MSGVLDKLKAAIDEALPWLEPAELRQAIDHLERAFSERAFEAQLQGEHISQGCSPTSWLAQSCKMSKNAASDRLCVGEQLGHLPRIAEALSNGEIGYQAASVICHLSDQLGEKRDYIEEENWIAYAQRFDLKTLRYLTYEAMQVWGPEGFHGFCERDYDRRYLSISEMGRMYRLDGMLDPEGGAALIAALDALSQPLGAGDNRTAKQRRADAAVELAHKAMNEGQLPRRAGVRPHVSVSTTIEGLKGELGAAASKLQDGMPISSKTVERLACDCTLHRVLKADSVVTDVGRATRAISGSQRRGVNARYRTCCGPGCDRPVSMTSVHHIEFWGKGGQNKLPNMLPLCYFHHRLVHEGGWQVVKAGQEIQWIPPDRLINRWAA